MGINSETRADEQAAIRRRWRNFQQFGHDWGWATFAWAIAVGLVALGGLCLWWLDIFEAGDVEVVTITSGDSGGVLAKHVKQSGPNTQAIVALALFALATLIAGPLKVAWEEARIRSHHRLELALREAERAHQVRLRVAERAHAYSESMYIPLLMTLRDIDDQSKEWAKGLAGTDREKRGVLFDRWLHAQGQYWRLARQRRLGRGFFIFRTQSMETDLRTALNSLEAALEGVYSHTPADSRSVLATAAEAEPRSLQSFRAALGGTSVWWWRPVALGTEDPSLGAELDTVSRKSQAAEQALVNGMNSLYLDWYPADEAAQVASTKSPKAVATPPSSPSTTHSKSG